MNSPTIHHQLTPEALAYIRSRYPAAKTDSDALARLVQSAAGVAALAGRRVVTVSDVAAVEARREAAR